MKVTAIIQTQARNIKVTCPNDKNEAISCLQNSVHLLNQADGRCKFVVLEDGYETYSWSYQPTFREEKTKVITKKDKSYILSCVYYILLNSEELAYSNLYRDSICFQSISEARQYMKEKGYSKNDYSIVYEYAADSSNSDENYGFGIGLTRKEAKERINESLSYYGLKSVKL